MSTPGTTLQRDLIFDIGMHTGLDTEWYLAKGFRVVAVEANPTLAHQAAAKFSQEIAAGRLRIENVGLADTEGVLPFYVNLENDEWSSFNQALGTRQGTPHQVLDVPCITANRLFERFGVPYYIKIDIEGLDYLAVRALGGLSTKPQLASVEDNGYVSLVELYNAGCRAFKFMDQVDKWKIVLPDPPLEGRYVDHRFGGCTSGPFGDEVPGDWMGLEEASRFYLEHIRPTGRGPTQQHWWDIHGKFGAQ